MTSIREWIVIGGEKIGVPEFLAAYAAVTEQSEYVDAVAPHPMSFFELTVI